MGSILLRYFYCIFILIRIMKRKDLNFFNIFDEKSALKKSQAIPNKHKFCFGPTSVSIYFAVLLHLNFIQNSFSIWLIFRWACWLVWVRVIKIIHCKRFMIVSLNSQMSGIVNWNLSYLFTLCCSSRFTYWDICIVLSN